MFDNSTAQSNCTASVEVIVFEDVLVESTETFSLTLHSSDAIVVFSTEISTVTIQDNDCEYIMICLCKYNIEGPFSKFVCLN